MSEETATRDSTDGRLYQASDQERDATMSVIDPIMDVLSNMPPALRMNILIGLCANIVLNIRLKDGSTPMDLWKDDLEPAVVKTIEVNMPDWREKQEMRKSIIGAFDKTFGTKEAAETGNG